MAVFGYIIHDCITSTVVKGITGGQLFQRVLVSNFDRNDFERVEVKKINLCLGMIF